MRLHRLEVAAFGPYAGHEQVDFDALGADGLFLLHGETGAGKTALLDAIAFALFGTVPGARGEVKRLRSDLADAGTATEVALELTVQTHRLRIVRGPEYDRPKRRGDGTTKQQAKASLLWLGDAPSGHTAEPITRIDEVARTVQRLLGMTADQFFQVVLLPQGEFARFLRADTAERERLLERLFDTRRFESVQDWFGARRKDCRAALELRRARLREWVARFAQAAGAEAPEGASGSSGSTLAWAAELRARAAEEHEQAQQAAAAARQESDRADAELAERRAARERVRRVAEAHAKLLAITGRAPELARHKGELADAQRAGAVHAAHRQADRALDEVERARELENAAITALEGGHTGGSAGELRARASELREQAGQLTGAITEAEQQVADERRLDELAAATEAASARATELARQVEALPEQASELRERLAAAADAAARVDAARARADELAQALDDARRLPAARRAAEAAAERLAAAIDAHQHAREHRQELRERRLSGMAAELAGELRDGEPCPVCGASAHLAPATAHTGVVGEADEREAERAEAAAHAERERAMSAKHEAEAAAASLRARVGDRVEPQLAASLSEAREAVAELAERSASQERLAADERALRGEEQRLGAERAKADRAAAEASAERASLAAAVAERARRLDVARGEHASVAERRRSLQSLAERYDALAAARSELLTARHRQAEQREAVAAEVREAGFSTLDEALAAAREPARLAELAEEISQAEVAERAARAVLDEPELAGVMPEEEVDVAGAQAAVIAAREVADAALVALRAASQRAEELVVLEQRLVELSAELAPAEAEFAELDAVTDVVNGRGQNARRMSLHSYVLAARLEEVALAATTRLREMSQGRFSFVHSDAAGARGTRGGLGLDVLDDYSGSVRPAKTLSGGESFLASLALALGLADVVAAETGGAQLDTLFIDEGFGTLDAETLDVVMNTLDGLRAGGRVVGLVSHVEELRQRIPTRLRVHKSRTGSTLRLEN